MDSYNPGPIDEDDKPSELGSLEQTIAEQQQVAESVTDMKMKSNRNQMIWKILEIKRTGVSKVL